MTAPLEFPTQPPTQEAIVETQEGARRLAGFLVRRYVSKSERQALVRLHFDH